jgi:hypothetical protein
MTSLGRSQAGGGARAPVTATLAAVLLLVLAPLAAGCAPGHRAGGAGQRWSAGAGPGPGRPRALGSAYLALAQPANRRLDAEVDRFTDHEHRDLAAAEAALRAEAATERRFDQLLRELRFPPRIAPSARALIRVNQRRAALAQRQASSSSVAGLVSFTRLHLAADAAVEAQVRILRRDLGLPPPESS